MPATPTSYRCSARLPIMRAVSKRFFRDGNVAGAGGNDENRALAGDFGAALDGDDAGERMKLCGAADFPLTFSRLRTFSRPRASPKCFAANLSCAAWPSRFQRPAAAFFLCRKSLRRSPGAARGDDPLSQSPDPRRADASGARWRWRERARRTSRIPEVSAIQADS